MRVLYQEDEHWIGCLYLVSELLVVTSYRFYLYNIFHILGPFIKDVYDVLHTIAVRQDHAYYDATTHGLRPVSTEPAFLYVRQTED